MSMFLRFVVGADDGHHRLLNGLITEARLLRDRGALGAHEAKQLETLYVQAVRLEVVRAEHAPHRARPSGQAPSA